MVKVEINDLVEILLQVLQVLQVLQPCLAPALWV
jgi:hypothetical protein